MAVKRWGIASALRGYVDGRRPGLPDHIAGRFRQVPDAGIAAVRESLERHYFNGPRVPVGYTGTEWGRRDLEDHLARRLKRDREVVVPWLDGARPLRGSRILEIGCGTGCSTVALAEQGAAVVAVDVDGPSVEVARRRCEVYGLDVTFSVANASEAGELFRGERFDFIIFYASLEHMTCRERIAAIRSTWAMLAPGDFWCIVETPNRLWHTDDHTSLLPFFHWLPDELAFLYAPFSPRPNFAGLYDDVDDDAQRRHFLRRGRGASFHEFAVAIGPADRLNVRSSLSARAAGRGPRAFRMGRKPSLDERYRSLLAEIYPAIHPGFLEKDLDLILMK